MCTEERENQWGFVLTCRHPDRGKYGVWKFQVAEASLNILGRCQAERQGQRNERRKGPSDLSIFSEDALEDADVGELIQGHQTC